MADTTKKEQLRLLVRDALNKISKSAYPNFASMIATKDGYKKAEDMIINYSVKNVMAIPTALALLESEMEIE